MQEVCGTPKSDHGVGGQPDRDVLLCISLEAHARRSSSWFSGWPRRGLRFKCLESERVPARTDGMNHAGDAIEDAGRTRQSSELVTAGVV